MQIIKNCFSTLFILIALSSCAISNNNHESIAHHVGDISNQSLLENYASFNHEYSRFQVSGSQAAIFKSLPDDVTVDIYFATWCHDSQREVPRMIKLLEHNQKLQGKLLALDFNKLDPQGMAQKAGIKYTPTFIVKKQGVEIGRIVERPTVDLISDIKNML